MKLCQKCGEAIVKGCHISDIDYGDLKLRQGDGPFFLYAMNEEVPESGCEFYLHKRINSAYKIFDEKARREFRDHLSGIYTAAIESQYFEEAMGRLRGNYE